MTEEMKRLRDAVLAEMPRSDALDPSPIDPENYVDAVVRAALADLAKLRVDGAVYWIEEALPGWGWGIFCRGEDYQAHLWSREDRLDGPEVFANAATPAEALMAALEDAKAGRFYAGS